MPLLLRTFGPLELVNTELGGHPLSGAGAQRMPLLILALAALTPGGISRDRLIHVLWPDSPPDSARASLKQHLYSLRRATGLPQLIVGSPRLRIATAMLQVDAYELTHLVGQSRLTEAAELLRGQLLEGIADDGDSSALGALVGEIRRYYAPKAALVRMARAERESAPVRVQPLSLASPVAERELRGATRRFVQGMVALPHDHASARHRAARCSYDLLEALNDADTRQLPDDQIREILSDARELWHRSRLVQQLSAYQGVDRPDVESMEWLIDGDTRTIDPVGRALEAVILEGDFSSRHREAVAWRVNQILQTRAPADGPLKVLSIAAGGARDLMLALPWLQASNATVVLADRDPDALALASLRLSVLGTAKLIQMADPFTHLGGIRDAGPFDLILTGDAYDSIRSPEASWLTETLIGLLRPTGRLCVSTAAPDSLWGAWARHVTGQQIIRRDHDELLALVGGAASECRLERPAANTRSWSWMVLEGNPIAGQIAA